MNQDEILGLSNDEIVSRAREMGVTDSQTRVIGVYYEASFDFFGSPIVGGPAAGGEVMRFVGVDLQTGQRVVADYGGLSAGFGVSLIPRTNVGGGAFGFTGEPNSLGGWSVGAQMSAGVTAGVSTNIDGSGILYLAGANLSVGANLAGGFTYRVNVDGYTVFDFGSRGDTYFQEGPSSEEVINIFRSNGLYGSTPSGAPDQINIVVDTPNGQRVIREYNYIEYPVISIDEEGRREIIVINERILDSTGNVISENETALRATSSGSFEQIDSCFGPEVPIDMWPLGSEFVPDPKNPFKQYDQDAVRAKIWKKPIHKIRVGDWVVSHDKNGNMVPGYVPRTFQNNAKILLDFHGTRVTPGHVYYRPDSERTEKYETLIDILRADGMIEHRDSVKLRAATNAPVDGPLDGFVKAVTGTRNSDGTVDHKDSGRIRLGTRFIIGEGNERKSFAVADLIKAGGGVVGDDELIRVGDSDPMPFLWEFGDTLPKPEDFVLACSGTTLEDIYKAAEWESQGPRLPAPMVLDRGPLQPLKGGSQASMPRNEPLDVMHWGYPNKDT
jgi:hypothetical protein